MPDWMQILVIALGGGLFLEGAVYALFPSAMQRILAEIGEMPQQTLRLTGLCTAAVGVAIIYLFLK